MIFDIKTSANRDYETININIFFKTTDDSIIFATCSNPEKFIAGEYNFNCVIPANTLNDIIYAIDIMVVENGPKILHQLQNIITIEGVEIKRDGAWMGKFPGLLRPTNYKWSKQKINGDILSGFDRVYQSKVRIIILEVENFDEHRFGKFSITNEVPKTLIYSVKQFIKRIIGYDKIQNKRNFNGIVEKSMAYIDKYEDGLEYFYNNVSANSKDIIVKIIAYRMLGFSKVKLTVNNQVIGRHWIL